MATQFTTRTPSTVIPMLPAKRFNKQVELDGRNYNTIWHNHK